MKKISFILLAGCALLITNSLAMFAQEKNGIASAQPKAPDLAAYSQSYFDAEGMVALKRNELNSKAEKDFVKTFKKAENARWYQSAEGLIAYFTLAGTRMRAAYDLKGNWIYTMATYTEERLPREVRHQVRSNYYDFAITLVDEIRTRGKLIYIVHMKDNETWLNLRVCEGEMEVLDQYKRAD